MSFLSRGQGMPMNVIIITILCLLVLVIVGWIFSAQSGKFVFGVNSCSAKGGECLAARGLASCFSNETILLTPDCKYYPESAEKKDGQCCISILG